jgi:hypothetical protein
MPIPTVKHGSDGDGKKGRIGAVQLEPIKI